MNVLGQTRKRKQYPPATWLRKITSPLVCGEGVLGHVYPLKNKKQTISSYNSFRYVPGLKNHQYRSHAVGQKTFYYQGNTWGDRTLLMIDVDVQKAQGLGSTQGAIQFIEYLKRHYFPSLYWEASTNGKGVHAYIVVKKPWVPPNDVNDSFDLFQEWLERRAHGFDIEMVEVKGQCPEIEWTGRKIAAMKFGSMAKIPRKLDDSDAFEALKKTTILDWREMRTLPDVDYPSEKALTRPPDHLPTVKQAKPKAPKTGSSTGQNISDEELARLPRYEKLAARLLHGELIKAGRHAVSTEDFAIAFLLLRFFKENANPDGSLPGARIEGMWTALFEAGAVDRPWNHHRWKAIRDAMSRWGLLTWHDQRYQPGFFQNGEWVKGVACKWEITDKFAGELDGGGGEASFMDTPLVVNFIVIRPERVWSLITPPHKRLERFIRWAERELAFKMAA